MWTKTGDFTRVLNDGSSIKRCVRYEQSVVTAMISRVDLVAYHNSQKLLVAIKVFNETIWHDLYAVIQAASFPVPNLIDRHILMLNFSHSNRAVIAAFIQLIARHVPILQEVQAELIVASMTESLEAMANAFPGSLLSQAASPRRVAPRIAQAPLFSMHSHSTFPAPPRLLRHDAIGHPALRPILAPQAMQKTLIEVSLESVLFPEELIPERFLCSISRSIMTDPVFDSNYPQVYYERQNIERWLQTNRTNPYNRQPLQRSALISNNELRAIIHDFAKTIVDSPIIQPFSVNHLSNEFIIKYRHEHPAFQQEYDRRY